MTIAIAAQTRWQSIDARSWQPGPFHVREDRPEGKRIWWVDEDGKPGLGEHRLEDLVYAERLPLPARVVVTEGEKAADAVRAAGLHAVGTVCGASATPGQEVVELFHGVDVTLFPDADPVGFAHANRLASRLLPVVADMRLVDTRAMPRGADAADFEPWKIRQLVADAMFVWLRR